MTPQPTSATVLRALEAINDPEIGHSIIGLGLVYGVSLDTDHRVISVVFTMTSPACPLADYFRQAITTKLSEHFAGWSATVTLTFDPPWSAAKIHDDVREVLALLGMPLTPPRT